MFILFCFSFAAIMAFSKITQPIRDHLEQRGPWAYKTLADLLKEIYTKSSKKTEGTGTFKDEDLLKASGQAVGRKKFPTLAYPLDLNASKQDKIQFDILEYKPSSFNQKQFGFDRPTIDRNKIGTVFTST